ncbi:hypothetical protein ACOSP7_007223 [Xanthoceras sorbifolium]|uniref:Transmembrane protein n=1 Tax=Xanthoceras sorbifolium TaxID=99658 RepID=A0ABQ8IA30_9ROSI|nr:hypothetical protein JRO89_XS03G0160000 [Xanthoceras sorbifolium]
MPKRVAVTHADLAPSPGSTELGSKSGVFLIVLTILSGLCCFILCLVAEATRSQMTWVSSGGDGGKGEEYECVYSGSGKTPLLCAAVAFVGLAVSMVVEHIFLLIAISKSPPPVLVSLDPDYSAPAKVLTWQAGFFFVSTWICFAVGEILLLIGLSVESGHLRNWSNPRPSCLIIKEGLFSAAGVFALLTVFLAAGLYLTALRAQRISEELENVRREVLEASAMYVSPPRSPLEGLTTIARENPIRRETQQQQQHSLAFPSDFTKHSNLV